MSFTIKIRDLREGKTQEENFPGMIVEIGELAVRLGLVKFWPNKINTSFSPWSKGEKNLLGERIVVEISGLICEVSARKKFVSEVEGILNEFFPGERIEFLYSFSKHK